MSESLDLFDYDPREYPRHCAGAKRVGPSEEAAKAVTPHRSVAQFLDVALPADCWSTTIPLGGGGMLRGAFLKSMGAKKETPDVLIVHAGRAYWIELKAEGGRVSPAQRECAMRLRAAGCPVPLICRSLDDVIAALAEFGIPVRARAA